MQNNRFNTCASYFFINLSRAFLKNKRYYYKNKKLNEAVLAKAMSGLNKNKIIIISEKNDKFVVKLTEKGRKIVKEMQFYNMKIEKSKKWDGRWRVVIFDIPENKRRHMRDAMRKKLQRLGFYQMQKSVWVMPYECEKEIQLICEVFNVSPFVNIITSEKIYNDDNLRRYFKV